MSLSPLLNENNTEPLRYENEYFLLKRGNISYELKNQYKTKYTGQGTIILTSTRIVILIISCNVANIKGIEIPLNCIEGEEYKQPFFGKNYLYMKGKSVPNSILGTFDIFIYFKGKSESTFINAFFLVIDSLRANFFAKHNDNLQKAFQENTFDLLFYTNNDDSSYIYQFQPDSIKKPIQNNFKSAVVLNNPDNLYKNILDINSNQPIHNQIINNQIINNQMTNNQIYNYKVNNIINNKGQNNVNSIGNIQKNVNNQSQFYMSQIPYSNNQISNINNNIDRNKTQIKLNDEGLVDPGFVYKKPPTYSNYDENNDYDDLINPYGIGNNNIIHSQPQVNHQINNRPNVYMSNIAIPNQNYQNNQNINIQGFNNFNINNNNQRKEINNETINNIK